MKQRFLATGLVTMALAMPAHADVVGVDFGVAGWQQNVSGSGSYTTGPTGTHIDVKDDLHLKDKQNGFFWVSIEHPVPILPNVRLYGSKFSTDGQGKLTQDITFGGKTFSATFDANSRFEVNQKGGVLYYEILDNVVSLDIGLDIRNFDGTMNITGKDAGGNSITEQASFNLWTPLLYARAEASLPASFRIGADGSYLGYSGNYLRDIRAWVAWQSPWVVGLEGGFRETGAKLDNVSNITADFKFGGPYIAVFVDF